MTESRVEELLRQMSLQTPSDELDAAIHSMTHQRPVAVTPPRAPWPLILAVAVASLLIGVFWGRVSASQPDGHEHSVNAGESSITAAGAAEQRYLAEINRLKELLKTSNNDVEQPDASVVHGNVAEPQTGFVESLVSGGTRQRVSMTGPQVAMVCAVGGHDEPLRTGGQVCLSCHDGLPRARDEFREAHMRDPAFATCMWCHDTKEMSDRGVQR